MVVLFQFQHHFLLKFSYCLVCVLPYDYLRYIKSIFSYCLVCVLFLWLFMIYQEHVSYIQLNNYKNFKACYTLYEPEFKQMLTPPSLLNLNFIYTSFTLHISLYACSRPILNKISHRDPAFSAEFCFNTCWDLLSLMKSSIGVEISSKLLDIFSYWIHNLCLPNSTFNKKVF